MIKAAFFDVDGTFFSHKIHGVPESHLKVLEALKENGSKTFLATGRHFEELKELNMEHIPFDGYVMLTGQICTDENKNLILKSAHPSPLSAYRGFFGCQHFSKTNAFLTENGLNFVSVY